MEVKTRKNELKKEKIEGREVSKVKGGNRRESKDDRGKEEGEEGGCFIDKV